MLESSAQRRAALRRNHDPGSLFPSAEGAFSHCFSNTKWLGSVRNLHARRSSGRGGGFQCEFGRAMTQAISQQLTKVYGESISKKELQRAGLSGENVSRWVPHSEITSDYDAKPGLNPDAPGQLLQGPVVRVSAELPNIAALGNRSPAVRQTRPLKETVFRRVVEAAGVDAALSQRMENLCQVDTGLAGRLQAEAEEICRDSLCARGDA